MCRTALTSAALACALGGHSVSVRAQSQPRECPAAALGTAAWVLSREDDIGIEIKHPADYEEHIWENRSDTAGVATSFWRRATSTINFHNFDSSWNTRGPKSLIPTCRLEM